MDRKRNIDNSRLSHLHMKKERCWHCKKPPTHMYKGKMDPYYYYFCDEHINTQKTLDDCVVTRLMDEKVEICEYSEENADW